jgi:hypothetical protein
MKERLRVVLGIHASQRWGAVRTSGRIRGWPATSAAENLLNRVTRMATPKIKSKAVIIGYDSDGKCVYSEILDLSDYYDGEHVWDKSRSVKRLQLLKVRGFLFDSKGALDQEFESVFDLSTGIYKSGFRRFADGVVHQD